MLKKRVIPTLLLREDGLVKTTKFKNDKYVGDPINAIKIFNEKEVDEIIVIDIDATKNKLEPNFKLIEQFASECFMPLCYGGGIKTINQARKIFSLGVEKISLQSSFLNGSDLLKNLVQEFGSQSIVASVDIKKNWRGVYKIFSAENHKLLNYNWLDYIKSLVSLGVGEILLNSVDKDGTQSGMDVNLIKEATKSLDVPLIASGGVGSLNDIKLASLAGASGISVGSFFVFNGPHKAVLISYPIYSELELLLSN